MKNSTGSERNSFLPPPPYIELIYFDTVYKEGINTSAIDQNCSISHLYDLPEQILWYNIKSNSKHRFMGITFAGDVSACWVSVQVSLPTGSRDLASLAAVTTNWAESRTNHMQQVFIPHINNQMIKQMQDASYILCENILHKK